MKKLKMKWVNTTILSLMLTTTTLPALSADSAGDNSLIRFKPIKTIEIGDPGVSAVWYDNYNPKRLSDTEALVDLKESRDFVLSGDRLHNAKLTIQEALWKLRAKAGSERLDRAEVAGFEPRFDGIAYAMAVKALCENYPEIGVTITTDSGTERKVTGRALEKILMAHPGDKVLLRK